MNAPYLLDFRFYPCLKPVSNNWELPQGFFDMNLGLSPSNRMRYILTYDSINHIIETLGYQSVNDNWSVCYHIEEEDNTLYPTISIILYIITHFKVTNMQ